MTATRGAPLGLAVAALLAALAVPAGAAAQTREPAEIVIPATPVELELATILLSDSLVTAQVDAMSDAIKRLLAADPDFAMLEQRSPGTIAEFMTITTRTMRQTQQQRMPEYRLRYAKFFTERFTTAELRELVELFGSPMFRKVFDVFGRAEYDSYVAKQLASEADAPITEEDLRGVTASALPGAFESLTSDDRAQLLRFAASPTGRKFRSYMNEMWDFSTSLANEVDVEGEARMKAELLAMMKRRFPDLSLEPNTP